MPARSLHQTVLASLLLIAVHGGAQAHDPGLSSATVTIASDRVTVDAAYSQVEIAALGQRLGQSPADFAPTAVRLRVGDREIDPTKAIAQSDDQNNLTFLLTFPVTPTQEFTVEAPLIASLSFGHRQFITVRAADGTILQEKLLGADDPTITIAASTSAPTPAAVATPGFVLLGIEHILTGFDHILFLAALLIVVRTYGDALRIITCFTIAHSVTLALATFNVVEIPSHVVEAIIAASIVYVAIENLVRRGEPRGRYLLTLAFGLVHGLGFASVLRSLGIGESTTGAIIPLISFNVGVEIGQIAIAAVTLPLLLRLRPTPLWTRWGVPATSVFIAAAGAIWLIDRVT